MKPDDFDGGRTLVAGSIVGLRAFRRFPWPEQLAGVVFPARFEPGENEAHCAELEADWFHAQQFPVGLHLTLAMTVKVQRAGRELRRRRWPDRDWSGHRVAGLNCDCGFYAYTDGSNEYAPGGSRFFGDPFVVEAVVEGYGTCTIGTRGFRASKARLLALVDVPDELGTRYEVPIYPTRAAALAEHPLTSVAS